MFGNSFQSGQVLSLDAQGGFVPYLRRTRGSASALLTSLVSYWKLDEASGSRVDSHGGNSLTAHSSPIGVAGKINNGVQLVAASSQYLDHASNSDLQTGDIDFTIAGWLYLNSIPTYMIPFAKDDGSSREWGTYIAPDGHLQFERPSSSTYSSATSSGTLSTGTWYYVVAWCDAAGGKMYLQINNGTPDQGTLYTGSPLNAAPFVLGIRNGSFPFDGIIDEVGFWKRVLTSEERSGLYNSGAGLAYPF